MKRKNLVKLWCLMLAVVMMLAVTGCSGGGETESGTGTTTAKESEESQDTEEAADSSWKFEVGSDLVEEEAVGASEYDPTFTVNLKIVGADEDVLFNGKVTLKSPTMMANEFLKAAVTDKGLAQSGIEVGFVETIGDYVNNSTDSIYWLYTVNGETPSFGSNLYQLRDGDYMLWTYMQIES